MANEIYCFECEFHERPYNEYPCSDCNENVRYKDTILLFLKKGTKMSNLDFDHSKCYYSCGHHYCQSKPVFNAVSR